MNIIDFTDKFNNVVMGAEKGLATYLRENPNVKTLVVGLSGGIDSTVTAALARLAIDHCFKLGMNISLVGISMPILTNKEDEIHRAQDAGLSLCSAFIEKDLSTEAGTLLHSFDLPSWELLEAGEKLPLDAKIRFGNIKARTRMICLYHHAHKYRGMVLSTDNYTEYLLGFWTLHGDVGDFGFIQELWKTEVYGLARFLMNKFLEQGNNDAANALYDGINAKPTDGLGVTNSDIDQLLPDWDTSKGSYVDAYRVIDETLIRFLKEKGNTEHPIIKRHLASRFKRENPLNLKRDFLLWDYN